jgi:hypothetical protein
MSKVIGTILPGTILTLIYAAFAVFGYRVVGRDPEMVFLMFLFFYSVVNQSVFRSWVRSKETEAILSSNRNVFMTGALILGITLLITVIAVIFGGHSIWAPAFLGSLLFTQLVLMCISNTLYNSVYGSFRAVRSAVASTAPVRVLLYWISFTVGYFCVWNTFMLIGDPVTNAAEAVNRFLTGPYMWITLLPGAIYILFWIFGSPRRSSRY